MLFYKSLPFTHLDKAFSPCAQRLHKKSFLDLFQWYCCEFYITFYCPLFYCSGAKLQMEYLLYFSHPKLLTDKAICSFCCSISSMCYSKCHCLVSSEYNHSVHKVNIKTAFFDSIFFFSFLLFSFLFFSFGRAVLKCSGWNRTKGAATESFEMKNKVTNSYYCGIF